MSKSAAELLKEARKKRQGSAKVSKEYPDGVFSRYELIEERGSYERR